MSGLHERGGRFKPAACGNEMRTVDVGKLRSKSASPQPTGRIAIVLILSGNSIRSSKSYAPACFALTFVCPISFTIQLHGSNFQIYVTPESDRTPPISGAE